MQEGSLFLTALQLYLCILVDSFTTILMFLLNPSPSKSHFRNIYSVSHLKCIDPISFEAQILFYLPGDPLAYEPPVGKGLIYSSQPIPSLG